LIPDRALIEIGPDSLYWSKKFNFRKYRLTARYCSFGVLRPSEGFPVYDRLSLLRQAVSHLSAFSWVLFTSLDVRIHKESDILCWFGFGWINYIQLRSSRIRLETTRRFIPVICSGFSFKCSIREGSPHFRVPRHPEHLFSQ
jgi:hypothetical protein